MNIILPTVSLWPQCCQFVAPSISEGGVDRVSTERSVKGVTPQPNLAASHLSLVCLLVSAGYSTSTKLQLVADQSVYLEDHEVFHDEIYLQRCASLICDILQPTPLRNGEAEKFRTLSGSTLFG